MARSLPLSMLFLIICFVFMIGSIPFLGCDYLSLESARNLFESKTMEQSFDIAIHKDKGTYITKETIMEVSGNLIKVPGIPAELDFSMLNIQVKMGETDIPIKYIETRNYKSSGDYLLQNFTYSQVQLTPVQGKTFNGMLLSAGETIVVLTEDNFIQIFPWDKISSIQSLSEEGLLYLSPTLHLHLEEEMEGMATITIKYYLPAADGLNWERELTGEWSSSQNTLIFSESIAITNPLKIQFPQAIIQIINENQLVYENQLSLESNTDILIPITQNLSLNTTELPETIADRYDSYRILGVFPYVLPGKYPSEYEMSLIVNNIIHEASVIAMQEGFVILY